MISDEELLAKAEEMKKALLNLKIQKATGQLNNTALLGQTRRDLARVLSVIKERKLKGKK